MQENAFSTPLPSRRLPLRSGLRRALACLAVLCGVSAVQAQTQQNLEQFTQHWIEQALQDVHDLRLRLRHRHLQLLQQASTD